MNAYRARIWSSIFNMMNRPLPYENVLDFGSGDGWFAKQFLDSGLVSNLIPIDVKRRSLGNQDLGKVGEKAPVAPFVGVSQGAAGDQLPDATVIELGADRPETGGDVAQALAIDQLGKSMTKNCS